MRLIAERISLNGRFSMRVKALDDRGEPLPFTDHVPDLTKSSVREHLITGLVRDLDCGEEKARALVQQLHLELLRGAGSEPAPDVPALPQIVIVGRQLRELEEDAWDVLQAANGEVGVRFVHRGGLLCEVVTDATLEAARPRVLRVASLRGVLGERADFVDFKGPAFPPRAMLEDLLEVAAAPLPELRGVIAAPLLTPSGEIVTRPGFHAGSGYFVTRGPALPPVPEHPSDADLERARRVLDELVGDFAFVTNADRTNAIAPLLTRLVRPLIDGPTPLFDIEAPTEGSGKGLLADVISLAATGRLPRTLTEGRDDDEWRKRITAALVDAAPLTLIDNVRRPLDSGQVSAVLTTREWSDRPLGASRIVTLPVETVWLMTANNPAFSSEIARRVVRIRIDPGVERPWLRDDFKYADLRAWTHANRASLLHALVVLVRAWQTRGRVRGSIVLGSFEDWAVVVGGILSVAGYEEFMGNREELYEEAARPLDEWRSLLEAWWVQWQTHAVTVGEVLALAVERELVPGVRAGARAKSAQSSMGKELARLRDRVIGEFRLRDSGPAPNGHSRTYRLERVPRPQNQV